MFISRGDTVSKESTGEDIRRRIPRLTMSLVMAVIFLIIGVFAPPLFREIDLPGLNIKADFSVAVITMLITAIFLVRALADALTLADIVTDIIVKRLGIKEERSPRRAARDLLYIIIIILIMAAISPVLGTLGEIGELLTTIMTLVALGLIIILIYDMGRILYRIVEQKAESVADRFANTAEQNKQSE